MEIEGIVEGIINRAASSEVILHIHYHINATEGVAPTPPPDGGGQPTPTAPSPPPSQYPNTTLVTVSNPDKPHALLVWAEKNNSSDYPIYTIFPRDSTAPEFQFRRIKIPNNTQLLVKSTVVRGNGGQLAFRIVDHDGYFSRLGDPELDVTKIYIRKEWILAE